MRRGGREGNTPSDRMIRRSPFIELCAAIILHGCASTGLNATPMRSGTSDPVVTIANRRPLAMHIYLRAGATTIPLGVVPGLASRQFVVPGVSLAAFSEVQLEASERGASSSLRSESFSLSAGRTAWWTLDPYRPSQVIVK